MSKKKSDSVNTDSCSKDKSDYYIDEKYYGNKEILINVKNKIINSEKNVFSIYGVGKTIFVKEICKNLDLIPKLISHSDLYGCYVGALENNFSLLFEQFKLNNKISYIFKNIDSDDETFIYLLEKLVYNIQLYCNKYENSIIFSFFFIDFKIDRISSDIVNLPSINNEIMPIITQIIDDFSIKEISTYYLDVLLEFINNKLINENFEKIIFIQLFIKNINFNFFRSKIKGSTIDINEILNISFIEAIKKISNK